MTPEIITTPPAVTPLADEAGRPMPAWFLYWTALTRRLSVLRDAVLGWGNLTTAGAIPKVSAVDGTLEESPLIDDGTTVDLIGRGFGIENNQYIAQKDSAGTLRRILTQDAANPDVLHVRNNQRGVGGTIALDSKAGGVAGATVDNAGNFDVAGVYKVAGTQVVGAQQAAITAPTGGGSSIVAPSGGAVIDLQARAAIAGIISAISSLGNTVDPTARTAINDIRARLTAHGLTL